MLQKQNLMRRFQSKQATMACPVLRGGSTYQRSSSRIKVWPWEVGEQRVSKQIQDVEARFVTRMDVSDKRLDAMDAKNTVFSTFITPLVTILGAMIFMVLTEKMGFKIQ